MQECWGQNREHWYAVQTKPRKERAVQSMLASRGIETYLPVLEPTGKRALRGRPEKPFFSCYLFAHLNLAKVPLSSINWSPGVTRVVSFGGQPAVVPDEVINWLRDHLARIDGHDYHQGLPLRPGDRLRVKKGPLKDSEVVFDRCLSSGDRARVFTEILGRLAACQIDLNCLARI